MQPHPQERIDTRPEPRPMAIIAAILAQAKAKLQCSPVQF